MKVPRCKSSGDQRVEKVFSPRCADFETFKKVSKSCLIERAVGFLPPAHTPPLLFLISLLRGFSTVCSPLQKQRGYFIALRQILPH